ncbi:BAH domain-containing protein [Chloropicon roscoffensis]|uniref:BAH domain-containing protein n=1 Tax=Chloropicon roscoffensis TaxID=1461544 RepID=A0AAX4P8B0_9CHLO
MEVEYAVAPNGGAEATKGEGQDPPEDVLAKSPPIPSIVDDDAAEGPSGSPVFTFLSAPTDTTPVARLIPGTRAGLEDLCKHESMEVGTIFEETGDQRLAPPLEPMPEGRVAKVFREVSVQNAHAGTTTTYRTDDFVYVATRDTTMPSHVCKIDHFLSWDNVEGKECKAVLLKRYLRADSPGASGAVLGATNASPERLPLEVYETSWHSIRRVEDVLGHASVVLGAGNVSTTPSSSDSHVCRYSYDHLSGRLEPLQGARVVEDEAAENNETVMALELMGAAVEAEAEDHSEAGESDAIIEEEEPSAPAGPAQLVAAENQGSVKRRKVVEPADLQNSVQPQNHPSGVLTFPLKLSTASLRSRWTQQRYENGQKFLFVALMDEKAFSRENAINRQALRQAVKTRGIGDLGLVDHIIKTLTEVPVLFSGYWIRKQHSHKGVLHYWLSQEVPGVNTVGLNQQQNGKRGLAHKAAAQLLASPDSEGSLELPKSILVSLKDLTTTLAVVKENVSKLTKADGGSGGAFTPQLAFEVVLQNVEKEMALTFDTWRKEVKAEVREELKAEGVWGGRGGGHEMAGAGAVFGAGSPSVAKLETELAVVKARQELHLSESAARIEELARRVDELQKERERE